ncbi:MAG: caspase family protein [bacterium]
MGNAHALLVGLKSVDPNAYNGWTGMDGCWGCELDVDNMERILKPFGYQIKMLKTAEATRNNILSSLYRAADNLTANDMFVFYYSGHGGQQPDLNGDDLDGKDETLVAYDREVIDDKIHEALVRFREGVCCVMISDSCNSGTNYRGRMDVNAQEENIFRPVARRSAEEMSIKAQLIHLGGCRDGFTSGGYMGGGAFTMALCEAWQNGAFDGSLKDLHAKICELIRSDQRPQYGEYGPVTDAFRNGRAFAVPVISAVESFIELPVIDIKPMEAEIKHAGEKHNYRFVIKKAGKYIIETEGMTDLMMTLYGPDDPGKPITRDDDSGAGKNPKIVIDLTPGTYYVKIHHYNIAYGVGAYTIKVRT